MIKLISFTYNFKLITIDRTDIFQWAFVTLVYMFIYICVYTYIHICVPYMCEIYMWHVHMVKVRGQLVEIGSLLPLWRF